MSGFLDKYAQGHNTEVLVTAEAASTFNQIATHTAASSIRVLSSTFENDRERRIRNDKRADQGVRELISGRFTNSWGLTSYFLPEGAANPPAVGPLLVSAFGTETIGASDVTYTFADCPAIHTITREDGGDSVMEDMVSCWTNEFTISHSGGDEPTMEWAGGAARHIHTLSSTAVGTVDGSSVPVSQITVAAGETRKFEVDSLVQIGASTGHRITTINHTGNTFDITPDVTTDEGTAPAIIPYSIWDEDGGAAVYTASPISMADGSVLFDSGGTFQDTDFLLQNFELTIARNVSMIDEVVGKDRVQDINYNTRDCTGTIGIWARRTDLLKWALSKHFDTTGVNPLAMTVTFGGVQTGDPRVRVVMPSIELMRAPLEIPDSEEGSISIPFRCRMTALGANDEVSLIWDDAP